jgi:hypothetical protein
MRPHITDSPRRLAVGAVVVAVAVVPAAFGLAGCGTKNNTSTNSSANPASSSTSGRTTAQFQIGNMLNYGSFGTTADLDCGDDKSLNVGGSNNTLTVKGTCSTVSIGGADNKIIFDKIDKHLTVVGLNNTITYKSGDPQVENLGQGNTINKG